MCDKATESESEILCLYLMRYLLNLNFLLFVASSEKIKTGNIRLPAILIPPRLESCERVLVLSNLMTLSAFFVLYLCGNFSIWKFAS